MARVHTATIGEIVMSRATLAGYDKGSLAKRTGIQYRTLCNRFSKGGWTLKELQVIHRYVHFEPEDMERLFGSET